jgi:hypothetical protein
MAPTRPIDNPTSGYSGTPLPKKLGIKVDMSVVLLHAPDDFTEILGPLPDNVRILHTQRGVRHPEMIIAFVTQRAQLEKDVGRWVAGLPPEGVLWVAWPKKASQVPTEMTDGVVREIVLRTGWVDIKVCAIDPTWSGLKFMLRKALRPSTR